MYKILHYLFGWDYISWENTADSGIARLHKNEDGEGWYFRYKTTMIVDLVGTNKEVFLTCSASKYSNIKKENHV